MIVHLYKSFVLGLNALPLPLPVPLPLPQPLPVLPQLLHVLLLGVCGFLVAPSLAEPELQGVTAAVHCLILIIVCSIFHNTVIAIVTITLITFRFSIHFITFYLVWGSVSVSYMTFSTWAASIVLAIFKLMKGVRQLLACKSRPT